MKNVLKAGDNSATLEMTVEVENGVLSVSSRFEFIPLEGKKRGFGMSSFVERMSLLVEDQLKGESASGVGRFLSVMDYQKSEKERQTSSFLYQGYAGFCREYYFRPVSFNEFLKRVESLGFEVSRCIELNETFVYCK